MQNQNKYDWMLALGMLLLALVFAANLALLILLWPRT